VTGSKRYGRIYREIAVESATAVDDAAAVDARTTDARTTADKGAATDRNNGKTCNHGQVLLAPGLGHPPI